MTNSAASVPVVTSAWMIYVPVICALIASSVTIIGIVLNSYFARKHKKEEQEHAIKKEIFLGFAEYISNSMALLQAVVNPSLEVQAVLSKYSEQAGVIGKMYVVAEPNLLLAARALVTELETYGSELVAMRRGLDNINLKVANLKESHTEASKALDNLNEHRLSLFRSGTIPTESVQSAHQWECDFIIKRLDELTDTLYKAEVEAYHSALSLFEIGITASQQVEEKTFIVLRLIKEQLKIPHQAFTYEEAVKTQHKKRAESAKKLIQIRKEATAKN
ncbi:hypothetical protein ACO0LG_03955 [Undibacterium sp. Ji42W]|uniref:hypothetical protein n=1 Tax=Undibacterium sp. Ji42W TaxID=3413039 RepID=UPI003BF3718D